MFDTSVLCVMLGCLCVAQDQDQDFSVYRLTAAMVAAFCRCTHDLKCGMYSTMHYYRTPFGHSSRRTPSLRLVSIHAKSHTHKEHLAC
jgi:hypothetical protein